MRTVGLTFKANKTENKDKSKTANTKQTKTENKDNK